MSTVGYVSHIWEQVYFGEVMTHRETDDSYTLQVIWLKGQLSAS